MSITAQVDTSSIDVSIDMNELRTEINEIIDETVPDMITEGIAKAGNHYEDVKALKMEVREMQKRIDELTARIVGAGCMLIGTRS